MANYRINCADRTEWLEKRAFGIGASEIGTIIGVNPFESPLELWKRKTGQAPAKEENFAMKAGHYLEDAVSQFFQDETGYQVIKNSAQDFIVVNRDKEFLRVSPDRYYWISDKHSVNNRGILECKTTQREIDAEDLPKQWVAQVVYQMGICEMQNAHLAWLTRGREFGYKRIPFAEDLFGWLAEEAEKFWTDCVLGGKEPALKTAADVLNKYPQSAGVTLALEEIFLGQEDASDKALEVAAACTDYRRIADEIKELEEKQKGFEEKIKLAMGEAEAITYKGDILATWKSAKDAEKFDTKRFKAENAALAAQYVQIVPGSRRFIVK